MNRIKKHTLPKRRIAERLRRAGFPVTVTPTTDSCDLVVDEHVRVALRVAFPRTRTHRVTVQGRRYDYRYRSWQFNFHHHGKMEKRYADVIVCLAMEPRDAAREQVFVIPWEAVSGKTFSLHAARHRYAGRYAPYLNRWQVITQAAGDTASRLREVA